MAYVPQFIPTNTQALQGTLNQYQEASDRNTGVLNQANDLYSALPTTNPYDTTKKNEIMGKFQKDVIAGLDKKYNYDRSNQQYAKDLASEIGKLRSDPLWTLVKQRDEVDKLRQNLIANKGVDYYENINPDAITDVNQLKEWRPMDIKDLERQVATLGKEHATSMRQQTLTRPTPGVLQFNNQEGFPDIESATAWLSGDNGQEWLEQSVQGTGFEGHMNDPMIRNRAMNAALGQLVGKPDIQRMGDPAWEEAQRAARAKKEEPRISWQERTNYTTALPSPISSFQELTNTNKKLQEIDANPNPTPEQIAERDILQQQRDHARDVYMEIANSPKGQESMMAGLGIIQEKITDPFISKELVFKAFEDYFVNTNSTTRSDVAGEGTSILSDMANDFAPWFNKGKDLKGQEPIIKSKSKKQLAHDLALEMFNNSKTPVDEYKLKQVEKELLGAAVEFDKYYKGKGNYRGVAYKDNIEKPINEKLKTGTDMLVRVFDPPFSTESAEYKQTVGAVLRNMAVDAFDVSIENKKGKLESVDKAEDRTAIYTQLTEAKDKLVMHGAMERESEPRIIFTGPDGKKVQLTMNIDKMTPATANELAYITGLPQFRDGLYKDINLENRTYTLDDNKDKTLSNILLKRYGTVEPFMGLKLTKFKDPYKRVMYHIASDKLTQIGFPDGITREAKASAIDELDDIYREYIKEKESKQ